MVQQFHFRVQEYAQKIECRASQRCLYTLIHDSIIYNYPKVKKKKLPKD